MGEKTLGEAEASRVKAEGKALHEIEKTARPAQRWQRLAEDKAESDAATRGTEVISEQAELKHSEAGTLKVAQSVTQSAGVKAARQERKVERALDQHQNELNAMRLREMRAFNMAADEMQGDQNMVDKVAVNTMPELPYQNNLPK